MNTFQTTLRKALEAAHMITMDNVQVSHSYLSDDEDELITLELVGGRHVELPPQRIDVSKTGGAVVRTSDGDSHVLRFTVNSPLREEDLFAGAGLPAIEATYRSLH
jgi:hypothetical protein